MTTRLKNLDDLVGSGGYFEHVSARAAFKLGMSHDRGLRTGSGDRSQSGGSFNGVRAEYFSNERSTNWNGYTDTALFPASGDRILLDILPKMMIPGPIHVIRSEVAAHALIDGEDYSALETPAAINGDLLPVGNAAAFPAFDLYLSNLAAAPDRPATAGSYPTIQLIANADLTAADQSFFPMTSAVMPETGRDDAWALWMAPAANLAADMGCVIWMHGLTEGK